MDNRKLTSDDLSAMSLGEIDDLIEKLEDERKRRKVALALSNFTHYCQMFVETATEANLRNLNAAAIQYRHVRGIGTL